MQRRFFRWDGAAVHAGRVLRRRVPLRSQHGARHLQLQPGARLDRPSSRAGRRPPSHLAACARCSRPRDRLGACSSRSPTTADAAPGQGKRIDTEHRDTMLSPPVHSARRRVAARLNLRRGRELGLPAGPDVARAMGGAARRRAAEGSTASPEGRVGACSTSCSTTRRCGTTSCCEAQGARWRRPLGPVGGRHRGGGAHRPARERIAAPTSIRRPGPWQARAPRRATSAPDFDDGRARRLPPGFDARR